ncbi:hypothetical protein FKP32DRAFT_1561275, partial [Trametes sanguinea]
MFGLRDVTVPQAGRRLAEISADENDGEQIATTATLRKKLVLKPREPTSYSGTASVQVFQKFALEAQTFLKGYNVPAQEHALTLSYYLSGKAWNFYVNAVMDRHEEWDVHRLLEGLFNHCFPMNHRQREREKLEAARQGNRTVKEFVHELTGYYSSMGYVPENLKVLKLWYGLDPRIQEKLWWAALTPETASWEDVRQAAELAEIARAASETVTSRSQSSTRNASSSAHGTGTRDGQTRSPDTRSRFNRKGGSAGPSRQNDRTQRTSEKGARAPPHSGPTSTPRPAPRTQASQPRAPLSEKERAELLAAGKCFVCKETGHLSRNCPTASRVSGNRKGGAPGLTSFNVELDLSEAERLRDLADSTARMDEIHLSNNPVRDLLQWYARQVRDALTVPFDPDSLAGELSDLFFSERNEPVNAVLGCAAVPDNDPTKEDAPLSLPKRSPRGGAIQLGQCDLYWLRATLVLEQHRPYFSDDSLERLLHFELEPSGRGTYLVHTGTAFAKPPVLKASDLRDPEFDIADWFRMQVLLEFGSCAGAALIGVMGWALAEGTQAILEVEFPDPRLSNDAEGPARFQCVELDRGIAIADEYLGLHGLCPRELYNQAVFNLPDWYACHAAKAMASPPFLLDDLEGELCQWFTDNWPVEATYPVLELCATGTPGIPAVQRNAAAPRDFKRLIPEPIVVVVEIDGHPARALLDSGSLSDFISTKLVHQLGIKTIELEKPLPVHLAVQGSRAKINLGCTAVTKYQDISEKRYFDVINILNYDLILGTPFLFQHQITLGLNPTSVMIGSARALPIEGKRVRVLESRAADILQDNLETARQHLRDYAADICADASDTPLPPFRAINHTIPLKDPSKVYTWRPSKCPDAHRASWIEKRDAYLNSGRWRMTNARNTSPMLLLTKPG